MASKAAALYLAMFAAAGCAVAQPKSQAPPPTPEEPASTTASADPPQNLDEAARKFDEAERELAGLFAQADVPQAAPRDEAEASAGAPAPPAAQPSEARPAPTATRRPDRCGVACRALASMRRSAARLCELSGEGDARCQDVQSRTERARDRVARTCPTCSTKSG